MAPRELPLGVGKAPIKGIAKKITAAQKWHLEKTLKADPDPIDAVKLEMLREMPLGSGGVKFTMKRLTDYITRRCVTSLLSVMLSLADTRTGKQPI